MLKKMNKYFDLYYYLKLNANNPDNCIYTIQQNELFVYDIYDSFYKCYEKHLFIVGKLVCLFDELDQILEKESKEDEQQNNFISKNTIR